ncbi:hypothetical protein HYX02_00830 [Candidatus Woesearchaeota archaeon]|nr:hypothetical protein [Candidatus Woesearchaeota archaeon]
MVDEDYHQYYQRRVFADFYREMNIAIERYKSIQQIKDENWRRKLEQKFLEEQRRTIRNFIGQEEYARSKLKEGLNLEQRNIEGWWERNIEFRRVKRNCMDRFDKLIAFAKKVEEILNKSTFSEEDLQTMISEIEDEVRIMVRTSEDHEVRKFGQGILAFCLENKGISRINIMALVAAFLMASSMGVYVISKHHIIPKDSQTHKVHFVLDDMAPDDWAAGEYKSYGYHTMLGKIVQYQRPLEGLQYKAYPAPGLYGNPDAKVLEIHKGGSQLLPPFMREKFGDIFMRVQALNKGETAIKIVKENKPVLEVTFHRDKPAHIQWNDYGYSEPDMVEMYHSVRERIQYLVNTNL